jgi:hypothetical protein
MLHGSLNVKFDISVCVCGVGGAEVWHLYFRNELLVLPCTLAGNSVQADGSVSLNLYVQFIQNFIEPYCVWHNLTSSFRWGTLYLYKDTPPITVFLI